MNFLLTSLSTVCEFKHRIFSFFPQPTSIHTQNQKDLKPNPITEHTNKRNFSLSSTFKRRIFISDDFHSSSNRLNQVGVVKRLIRCSCVRLQGGERRRNVSCLINFALNYCHILGSSNFFFFMRIIKERKIFSTCCTFIISLDNCTILQ